MRKRRAILVGIAMLISSASAAIVLAGLLLTGGNGQKGRFRMDQAYARFVTGVSNEISDAMGELISLPKRYWISRDSHAAPKPNPQCYSLLEEPEEMRAFLNRTREILEGQHLYFSPDTPLLAEEPVRVYLDDTILVITWKQPIDGGVYTFSEIKIMHPSQFRRFLAGGEYGSDQQEITTEMARSVNAVVASSGDFYGYRRSGIIVYDGKVRRTHSGLVDTCYIDEEGDLHITKVREYMDMKSAQSYVEENRILFSLAFGPELVREGKVCTPKHYSIGEINDCYPRAALCQMDRLHYLLAVVNTQPGYPDTPDIHTFAHRIQETGCVTAYALDGGQTAAIVMDNSLVSNVMYGSQRRISDIIYFATAIPDGSGKES